MHTRLHVSSLNDTIRLGAALAEKAKARDCYLLHGDLGAGKTELARAFIRQWCKNDTLEVTSPTFNLVQTYQRHHPGKTDELWHFDLYRIKHAEELQELALDEALERGVVIIEWPGHAPESFWPESALHIHLEREGGETARNVRFSGNAAWDYVKGIKI